jgi:O-antigen/teichoic acid export membrane protein
MSEQQNSYRQILKATSLFGGVQVFQILTQIIKSKVVAVLLGTTGMGISGLLTSTTGFIGAITNFGLGTSGIKSIAEANGSGDENKIGVIISVLGKCIWITGILGMLITLMFSPWLSQLTFGNKDYTIAFIWLSITMIFNQLSTGQLVILQGLRKYNYLANANLTGAILGLIISLPLYYYLGIDGIVPAIIGTSLLNLVRSWYFVRKIEIRPTEISRQTVMKEGKLMLQVGFMVSLSGFATIGTSYIIRLFISHIGGIQQVGLYNAGFTLLNSYVGLVFSAMATDYFPRLSTHAEDNAFCQKTINEQADISFLLLTPILVIFLIFCPIIIRILYSTEFISIDKMLYWAILGMLFRIASWSISFVFLAKGHAKIFFWNEVISNFNIILLNTLGYYLGGLEGIGKAFVLTYVLYLLQMSIVSYRLYKIKIKIQAIKLFLIQFIFTLSTFTIALNLNNYLRYLLGIPIVAGCLIFSYSGLDKRINLSTYLATFIKRNQK